MNAISTAISGVTIGLDVSCQNLTMFPLLGEPEPDAPVSRDESTSDSSRVAADYVTLDEALGSGWARVTETSESGSVPELRFVNTGAHPVFILDGEELVGARQNRVVNLSLLVPAKATLTIPVSCVEAGRWRVRSLAFAAAPRAQYAAGRARKIRQVTASMLSHGARSADQAAVWDDIAAKALRLQSHSPTAAMEAMFVDYGERIEQFVEALPPFPAQRGALFAINDRIIGFDLFATPRLLRRLLPKLVRSCALDALDPEPAKLMNRSPSTRSSPPDASLRTAAMHFLAASGRAKGTVVPALGLGQDVRIEAPGLTAAALVHDEVVVHLSSFAH
jgi:hypothetical protein